MVEGKAEVSPCGTSPPPPPIESSLYNVLLAQEYRQDCSTVVTVARLFTGYSEHLEHELEKTMRMALAGIGQRYVSDFESWLKEMVPNAVGEFHEGDTSIEAT